MLPPFAYQDGDLHATNFSALNAIIILRFIRDINEKSRVFIPIFSAHMLRSA